MTKSKIGVGLDIGSHAIKMVEISNTPDRPILTAFGMKKIAGQPESSIPESIKALAEELKISSKEAAISVSGPSVIERFISMPKMTDDELKSAIRYEAEKFIPFDINDSILDFQVLRKNIKENKLDILLVASKREHVEEKVAMVEAAGYSVSVVDVDSLALANAFFKNFPASAPDKTFAILNVGWALTNLSISKDNALYLARDIPIAGKDFDAALSKEPAADAKTVYANLLEELRLPFSYYENQYGRNIDEIYLSGGASGMAGMEDALRETFGLKPAIWDPLKCLDAAAGIDKHKLETESHSFAVAAGLALR